MSEAFDGVKLFHKTYKLNVGEFPALPDTAERDLRINLLKEEWSEYLEGEMKDDLVNISKELCDMLYIIYGTAVSYGIPMDAVFAEVQRSNMSKLGEDGKPIFREDGKVLKGPNYSPANIQKVIDDHSK